MTACDIRSTYRVNYSACEELSVRQYDAESVDR